MAADSARSRTSSARAREVESFERDSLLIERARRALTDGALDSVSLMAQVCALPGAPPRVAERLAEALFARHGAFSRDGEGRWMLLTGDTAPALASPLADGPPTRRTVAERRAAAPSAADDDVPLRDLRFAVVDVETTGTSPGRSDRVTEVAIVEVASLEVTSTFETLVNPQRPIPGAIVALTRITDEMVRGAPLFREVASDIVQRLRQRIFVAHNAAFDWRFVSHEVRRAAGVELAGETLCTVRLARALLPHLPRRSLDAVTHHFGITIEPRHRALGDALATAQVLVRLLRLAEDRGADSWRSLDALVRPSTARRGGRRRAMPRPVDIDPTL